MGGMSDEVTLAGPTLAPGGSTDNDDATHVAAGSRATSRAPAGSRALTELLRGTAGPTRLGHYVLLNKLGQGGMGVVFAAYDEKLDRKVAIKLLRAEVSGDAQRRLIREAQAMARLSHPNVVQIYEIGELDGGLTFIVMEFIDGVTLRAWRERERCSVAELLAVFAAAGRGLAAAHAKGLVHRDFKPDNVMVCGGRVVVMDFGLAREHTELCDDSREGDTAEVRLSSDVNATGGRELSVDLTATGALMGTPAYMAPEQFRGEPTDAKTDQFSFCVALWEALHGRRPFAASSVAGLSMAVTHGERVAPTGGDVPSWLQRVLERGLAVEPSERWPSMQALLDALAADPTRRRRWIIGASVTAAVVVAAVVGARVSEARAEARARDACAVEAQAIDAVWSDAIAAELGARFESAAAADAWTHASAWMDGYARDWATTRERSCLAARVDRSKTEADHAQVAACLDDGRLAAEALVDVWRGSEARNAASAASAAAGLPPISACENDAWLAQRPAAPTDTATRDEVTTLRAQLEHVKALRLVGEFETGLAQAQAVLERAAEVGWTPLEVEARLEVGELERELGRFDNARTTLERAGLDAIAVAHDLVALRAAISLTSVVGYELSDHAAGRIWSELASKLLERMRLEGTVHEAALRSSIGDWQWSAGHYDASLSSYLESLDLYERALGAGHPKVGTQLDNVGYLHKERGEYVEALRFYRRALALFEAALGPEHPNVGEALTFIGESLQRTDDLDGALAAHERALAVFEVALGPEHPRVADALNNLGSVLSQLDRSDDALASYERALAVSEAALGPEHPAVATALNNIALCRLERGQFDLALASFQRALELSIAARGPEHQYVGIMHNNVGGMLIRQAKPREALVKLERARTILAGALGPDHPFVARTLTSMAEAHAALGELGPAHEAVERALTILEATSGSGRGKARFVLAKLLAREGEREQARALAELARADYVEAGNSRSELEAIDAWLSEL